MPGETRRVHLVVDVIDDGTEPRELARQLLAGRRPDARAVDLVPVDEMAARPHTRHEALPGGYRTDCAHCLADGPPGCWVHMP